MIKVGLTGNIGSGKTTVARIFAVLGAAVFNADNEAKKILVEPKQHAVLSNHFGNQIIGTDQKIDRKLLAQKVFNDTEALNFVNQLIHPLVRNRFFQFCESQHQKPICIYEAAVLIETGFYSQLDKVILVCAPEEKRISRAMQRDGISRELVLQRAKSQWDENKKFPFADYVIQNDERRPLMDQCMEVFDEIIRPDRPTLLPEVSPD